MVAGEEAKELMRRPKWFQVGVIGATASLRRRASNGARLLMCPTTKIEGSMRGKVMREVTGQEGWMLGVWVMSGSVSEN
jgi:hypothetical protein